MERELEIWLGAMHADQEKVFVGDISSETTSDVLKDYFGSYGEILHSAVMRDWETGRSRGFGVVVFADPYSIPDRVFEDKHIIDGTTVEVKRRSRERKYISSRESESEEGSS